MNGIKVIHLIHQNVNSLQAKIGEIRYIADRTKAAVIGITESKLDKSTFQSEIQIDNCDLLWCDRNRNGRGVAYYIRSDIGYVQNDLFPNVIENIFFEILLPKTTPLAIKIMYRPPSQTNFLEILNMTFEKVDIDKKRVTYSWRFQHKHISEQQMYCSLWYHNNKYIVLDDSLTIAPSRVSQKGEINVSASDHQLIFCTRKISRMKTGGAHKYLHFRSFKNYTADYYTETLKQIDFPN